jgi:hypothetical protein
MQCPFFNYNSRVQDPDLLLNQFIELKNMTIWLIQPIEGAANPVQFNGLLTLIGWLSVSHRNQNFPKTMSRVF